jgi:hypothetical protein
MIREFWKPCILGMGMAWVLAGWPSIASAQFQPRGFPSGFYWTSPFGTYAYNYNYRSSFNYAWVNPITRQPYVFSYSDRYSGMLPPYLMGGGGSFQPYPTISPNYYSQMRYSSSSMANPVIRDQLKFFAGGQPAPAGAPQPNFNNFNPVPMGGATTPPKGNAEPKGKPVATNAKLTSPADAAIQSGDVLNALLKAIRDLENRGAVADSPLLPAELLKRVQFAGAPGAEAMMTLRQDAILFPSLLERQEFLFLKAVMEEPLASVVQALKGGRAAAEGDVKRLADALAKAEETLQPKWQEVPPADATEAKRFLTAANNLMLTAKANALDGIYVSKWFTVGASVRELVQHLDQYSLSIAPARQGDEQIYRVLHRGFVVYYKALAANGVK